VQDWQLRREGDAPTRQLAQRARPNTEPRIPHRRHPRSTRRSVRSERLGSERFLHHSSPLRRTDPRDPASADRAATTLDEILHDTANADRDRLPPARLHAAEIAAHLGCHYSTSAAASTPKKPRRANARPDPGYPLRPDRYGPPQTTRRNLTNRRVTARSTSGFPHPR
jgi:hypothetical protein